MSDVYKTYRNNSGETLKIVYAENCDNPLEDSDRLFNYYTWLSRHRSIHPNEFHSAPEFIDFHLGEGSFDRYRADCLHKKMGVVQFADYLCDLLNTRKGIVAFPILSQEHSSIHYYLGRSIDRWEGSIAGFAWVEKSKLYTEYSVSKISAKLLERMKKYVSSELDMYNKWVNGEVFGYQLIGADGNFKDSCYGFYENDDDLDDLLNHILSYVDTDDDKSFVEVSD